jgi:hypothetical protein
MLCHPAPTETPIYSYVLNFYKKKNNNIAKGQFLNNKKLAS